MAEAVIGVTGVAVQLFVSCIQSYKAFLVAKECERDSSILITKLQIEEARLHGWGEFLGLIDGTPHDDLAQDGIALGIILKTLGQIKQIFGDTANLSNKYGLEDEFARATIDEPITSPPVPAQTRAKGLRAMRALKQSCSWLIVDREKFNVMIKDLKDFNDGLHSTTLLAKERQSLTRAVVCTLTAGNQSASRLDNIRSASSELRGATEMEPYRTIQAVTSFRFLSATPSAEKRSLLILKTSVALSSLSQNAAKLGESSIGSYNGRPVLIEWRSISKTSNSGPRLARLTSLLALSPKPPDFRVLDLAGYYEDTSSYRICFVSHFPTSLMAITMAPSLLPVSLYNLIARSGTISVPPLGERFRLAQTLSASLLQLHSAGWLHRRVRSRNVLFLRRGESPTLELSQVDLTQPFVSGFGITNKEHDLYHHRAVATPGAYRREYDVYSLGMILLEIGLWTRLSTIGEGARDMKAFTERVKAKHVPKLGYKCGTIYEGVVRGCLEAPETRVMEDGDNEFWEWEERKRKEQTWFYWEVVKELEKCCA
ncbi:hypothetical protein MMC25_007907 [Agyrium rufum]|nr:hypothetical protein [Agyrium rufum]